MTEQQVIASFFLTEPTTNIGSNPNYTAFGLPAVIAPSNAILRHDEGNPDAEWEVLLAQQDAQFDRFNEYGRPYTMLVVLDMFLQGRKAIGIVRPADSENLKAKYVGPDKLIIF